MTNDELAKKRKKAEAYSKQPERFKFLNLEVEMESTHDIRCIQFENGKWSCTCEFFSRQGTCSHVMAIQEILKSFRFHLPD
ncbi:SWIM zinc finger family protein [Phototrophicus methaneseepsis]|uniref:SWIM zinc finger family protein n=1 Tax=Phototrophicus methaneseepsis TaxID=2710758 RepID=UPI0039C8D4B0